MEQPITIKELQNRFSAMQNRKYPIVTISDVEDAHQKGKDAETNKLLKRIRQLGDRVLAIINTANQLYDFKIDYRMLSVMATFIAGTKTNSFDIIPDGYPGRRNQNANPYSQILVYFDRTPVLLDSVNIYTYYNKRSVPDKKIIKAVLDDFDTLEEFFYDYLDYLSQGYVFKEKYMNNHQYNTIYRVRGKDKVYYYDGAQPQPILKSKIRD